MPFFRSLTAMLCGLLLASATSAAERPRPNVVFILADDLGSHDVGWRGSQIKTPHLDRLAKSGARLNQFYVQPVCTPTRAALMTGRYPLRHGLQTGVVRPWAQYGLPLEERTLPQTLREAGYETAIVGKWHLGHFQPAYLPTRRGFDHQYGHYNGALDYYTHIRDGGFDWHKNDQVNRDEGYSTELLGLEAVRRIKERDAAKPLFLYVPFNGVHAPHQVPASYEEAYPQFKGKRKTYAGMVTAVDDAVGKITAALASEKLLENTLIVFSSDNGGPSPGTITSNGSLRAGKGTLYEGGVRVCAFASWPGHIESRDVEVPLHMTDWYPTLLQLAGANLDQPLPLDGRDLWPALTEGKSTREEIVINSTPTGGAIRVGDWKLVLNGSPAEDESEDAAAQKTAATNERVELFDLAADSSEKHNLATEQPEKVAELRSRLAAIAKDAVPPKARAKPSGFISPKVWGEE
jgi:arylsulfatase A-like enzyme